jgi:hypothetical protein
MGTNDARGGGKDVLGKGDVDLRQQTRQATIDHAARSVPGLLGRLKDQRDGSRPAGTTLSQQMRRA